MTTIVKKQNKWSRVKEKLDWTHSVVVDGATMTKKSLLPVMEEALTFLFLDRFEELQIVYTVCATYDTT